MRRDVTVQEKLLQADQHRISGQYDEAVALYQEVLGEDPSHFESHVGLGLVYGFTGLFDESIDLLKKAVELRPESPDAILNLGKTYTMLGMYEEARPALVRVLEIDPENLEATKQLHFLADFGF
ncbi:MAG: tetratricopeptide repeat protein [Armatimonadetes bacterium]|nr:tetratricopeptide repeat protein [Armatimonadota bacterium]